MAPGLPPSSRAAPPKTPPAWAALAAKPAKAAGPSAKAKAAPVSVLLGKALPARAAADLQADECTDYGDHGQYVKQEEYAGSSEGAEHVKLEAYPAYSAQPPVKRRRAPSPAGERLVLPSWQGQGLALGQATAKASGGAPPDLDTRLSGHHANGTSSSTRPRAGLDALDPSRRIALERAAEQEQMLAGCQDDNHQLKQQLQLLQAQNLSREQQLDNLKAQNAELAAEEGRLRLAESQKASQIQDFEAERAKLVSNIDLVNSTSSVQDKEIWHLNTALNRQRELQAANDAEHNSLASDLAQLRSAKADGDRACQEIQNQTREMKKEIADTQREMFMQQNRLQASEAQNQQLQKQMEEQQNDLDFERQLIQSLATNVDLKGKSAELEHQRAATEAQRQVCLRELEEMRAHALEQEHKLQTARDEVGRLAVEAQQAVAKKELRSQEVGHNEQMAVQLKIALKEAQVSLATEQELHASLLQANTDVQELRTQNAFLEERLREAGFGREGRAEQVHEFRTMVQQKTDLLAVTEETNEKFAAELKQLQAVHMEKDVEFGLSEERNSELTKSIHTTETTLHDLKRSCAMLTAQVAEAESRENKIKAELVNWRSLAETHTEKLQTCQSASSELASELHSLQEEKSHCERRINDIESHNSVMKRKVDELHRLADEKDGFRAKSDKLERELRKTEEKRKTLEEQLDGWRSCATQQEAQLEADEVIIARMREEVEQLEVKKREFDQKTIDCEKQAEEFRGSLEDVREKIAENQRLLAAAEDRELALGQQLDARLAAAEDCAERLGVLHGSVDAEPNATNSTEVGAPSTDSAMHPPTCSSGAADQLELQRLVETRQRAHGQRCIADHVAAICRAFLHLVSKATGVTSSGFSGDLLKLGFAPVKIDSHIVLGGARASARELKEFGVGAVVNLMPASALAPTYELQGFKEKQKLRLHVEDNGSHNICEQFAEVHSFIQKQEESDIVTYVHCTQGINASAAFVISYLAWRARSLDVPCCKLLLDAWADIANLRKHTVPLNRWFQKQLILWALDGFSSRRAVADAAWAPLMFRSRTEFVLESRFKSMSADARESMSSELLYAEAKRIDAPFDVSTIEAKNEATKRISAYVMERLMVKGGTSSIPPQKRPAQPHTDVGTPLVEQSAAPAPDASSLLADVDSALGNKSMKIS